MTRAEAGTRSALARLATRPGWRGVIGSLLEAVADFPRELGRALTSLPYEYESRRRLLGWPLLAVNVGPDSPDGEPRHARGVIALGNRATGLVAIGIFLARGGLAIGIRAAGLCAISVVGVGLVSVSVVGLGIVSISVVAVGYLAVGIVALGYKCVGILAIGKEVVGIMGAGREVRALFGL